MEKSSIGILSMTLVHILCLAVGCAGDTCQIWLLLFCMVRWSFFLQLDRSENKLVLVM